MRITSRFFIIFLSASLIVMLSCAAFIGWVFLDFIWENEQETIEHHFGAARFYLDENLQLFRTLASEQANTWPGLDPDNDNELNANTAEYFINHLNLPAQRTYFIRINDLPETQIAGRYLNAAGESSELPASITASLDQLMRQNPSGINSPSFLAVEDEIYLVAVSPLRRSGADQPIGRFILGQRVDPELFGRLFELTRISFAMTSQWPLDLSQDSIGTAYYTADYDRLLDSEISAYYQLQDDPLILLQLSLQRKTYRSQLAAIGGFMLVLLAFASTLIIIVLVLINQRILIPIGRFTEKISRLNFNSYEPLRFSRKASPELQQLGQTINQLMLTIRDEQEQLRLSESCLRESERVKTELLQRDVLTGIYNRRFFEQALLEAEQRGECPLSLMIGDINGLKLVNDAFGHQSGDTMIIQAARILQSCCREEDIIARTGGDEFILILPNTNDDIAYKLMKKIQGVCVRHNNRIRDEELHVSISLGYATRTDAEQKLTGILEIADDYMRKHKLLEKRSSQSVIVSSILATLYERSQETEEHAQRLAALSQKIGNKLKLTQLEQDQLILLARLHDIGKISISRHILNKPGKLTEQEWAEMRAHPEIGCRIATASPQLLSIAELILTHHEHWDGRGYPQGLSGEAIPLLSRIIALVDAYDVMTQDRPYRKAISKAEALAEIHRCAGSQFDPRIADIFIELISETE